MHLNHHYHSLPRLAALAAVLALLAPSAYAQVPQLLNYQGRVAVGTVNFNGSGQFKFALVQGTGPTLLWKNDGSAGNTEPVAAVTLTVTRGLYSVLLGDTTPPVNMTAIPTSVFANSDVRLRVWFNDNINGFQLLTPDQRLAPNGYLADGSVSSSALAANAVTSAKIAPGAVGNTQLANGIDAGKITGTLPALNGAALTGLNAGNLTIGTLADARLSGNVALRSGGNTFSGQNVFNGLVGIGDPIPRIDRAMTIRGVGINSDFLQFRNAAGGDIWHLTGESGGMNFVESGVADYRLFLAPGGNVGIGTAAPATKLEVAGTVTAERFVATAVESPANVIPVLGMAWIKPGTFVMGSRAAVTGQPAEPGRFSDEGPQTVVTLTKGFWMGVHEVTQAEYFAVAGSNPSAFTGDANRPVEQVSWTSAVAYCTTLTTTERTAGRIPVGWGYRLPTEAEWEYACRAGARTTRFGYGDDLSASALGNYAWYFGNSGSTTHPVEQKLANPWGLMDMHGNVWEWCQDWYGAYLGGSATDPRGPATGSFRVIRGGGWNGVASSARCAYRGSSDPGNANSGFGFRAVLAPGQP